MPLDLLLAWSIPAALPTAAAVEVVPLYPDTLTFSKRSTKKSLVLGCLGLMALIGAGWLLYRSPSALALYARAKKHVAHVVRSPRTPASATVPSLEQDSEKFETDARTITNAQDCFPMHLRDVGGVGILYLYCSNSAYESDGEGREISEDFKVPSSIARRFNFWRRVYSLWDKDQYVMHLSEYPEVVVEAYDASRLSQDVSPRRRENLVKKVAKTQRDLYRKLFLAMHEFRSQEDKFTPAMKRLASAMAHIKDKDKYLVAYRSLRLQRGQRDFIAKGLAVAPKYLTWAETEFKAQGIPIEITRLAFVESSFNLKAQSKVGASGVYQIMPTTGRQYLKILGGIDERNDPVKASRAAAKLLRLNYDMTGNWPLAITAYNHGVGGIRRATRAVGSTDIAELINRYHGNQFGFASKNFYSSFLAVLSTLKDAQKLFPEVPRVEPINFEPLRLAKPTTIRDLRRQHGVSLATISELNPDISYSLIRKQGSLPRNYVIKLPPKKGAKSLASVP